MLKKINKCLFRRNIFNFSQKYDLKEGDLVSNFKVTEIKEYPDFKIKSYNLKHIVTESEYLHLDAPDKNNCFSVQFKTIPKDDKGTPHILEHLVTCGSSKYPIRDPFMRMSRRSLNTYMNAWTGPDFTAYPFSSQNEKDFKNLMNLYTSLCFQPLLNYHDFMQEGWRYELIDENKDDENNNEENSKEKDQTITKEAQLENKELAFKGVVFNEMKGVYQGSTNVFIKNLIQNLYKGSAYCFDFGGDPEHICKLTHSQLLDFFKLYYHPSNMKFFSYGDFDFTDHLKYLEENYLKNYQKSSQIESIALLPRFSSPKSIVCTGPSDGFTLEKGKDSKFCMMYLCNDTTKDYKITFALNILSYMLFETPNSPFYKNLIENGLAPSFCPGYGYDSSYREGCFGVGVQGVGGGDEEIKKIEETIKKTFETLAKDGFDKNLIEGTLHQIEINSRIKSTNFGISLLGKMLSSFMSDGNCKESLEVNKNIDFVREEIKKGRFFENLIDKYFIQNPHHIKVLMNSDEEFTRKKVDLEKQELKKIKEKMTREEMEKIIEDTKKLKAHQEKEGGNDDVLPTLEISDIPTKIEKTTYQSEKLEDIPIRLYDQPTNGLTHFRMKFDLEDMTPYLRQYLYLFNSLLPKLGTQKKSYNEMSDSLSLNTTDLGLSYFSYSDFGEASKTKQNLVLNIACLDRNASKMFELLGELLTEPNFKDAKHIKNLLKNLSSEKSSALAENSMKYALSCAASKLRESEKFVDSLSNTRFLCNYTANLLKSPFLKEYIEDLDFHLGEMITFLLNKNRISFSVHSESSSFVSTTKHIQSFITTLKNKNGNLFDRPITNLNIEDDEFKESFVPSYEKTFFTVPGQVNYVVESFETTHMESQDFAKLNLLCDLMENTVLHSEIREKGGAYGSGCKSSNNGYVSFYSYRDPRHVETLDSFREAIKFVSEGSFSELDIKEAKLKLFSHIDREKTPQEKGISDFIYGLSEDKIETYRQNVLAVQKDDLIHVAREYLSKKIESGQSSKVIFGSETLQKDENLQKMAWKFEKPLENVVQ